MFIYFSWGSVRLLHGGRASFLPTALMFCIVRCSAITLKAWWLVEQQVCYLCPTCDQSKSWAHVLQCNTACSSIEIPSPHEPVSKGMPQRCS